MSYSFGKGVNMNKQAADASFSFGFCNKQSVVGFITLLLCVCLIALFFLSTTFILTNADHKHDHHGPNGSCAMCVHMMTVENLLKKFYDGAVIVVIIAFFLFPSCSVFMINNFHVHIHNPIQLKVRLNN